MIDFPMDYIHTNVHVSFKMVTFIADMNQSVRRHLTSSSVVYNVSDWN